MPTAPITLLSGAPNFRDMGGYLTADGRKVRSGVLFRSEGLSDLTEADLDVVERLGIRLLCDLRSDQERAKAVTRWPPAVPVNTLHLNISADLRASYQAMTQALLSDPSTQGATEAMLASYRQFPHAFVDKLRLLFEQMLDGDGVPVVFHCAAGKDRTGFVAATLLTALGVPWPTIVEDYLLTARHWHGPRSEAALQETLHAIFGSPPSVEVMLPLMAVEERYLAASLEEITRHYHSFDGYLQAAGLDPQRRAALRDALLE